MSTTTSATTTTAPAKNAQTTRHRRDNATRPTLATAKRSYTGAGDDQINKRRKLEPVPYVRSNAYILSKFAGNAPSLIVHLYDDFWRLEGQESSFSYGQNSPMQVFLKHIREGTVPHDLLSDLHDIGTSFYDGCLIVQVKNYRSSGNKTDGLSEKRGKDEDGAVRFSMHNWTEHITPSPYVPFPQKARESLSTTKRDSGDDSKKSGSMPPPDNKDPKRDGKIAKDEAQDKNAKTGPKVTTLVLHPTALSMHMEMLMLAATPLSDLPNTTSKKAKDGRTPSVAQPPTPSLAAPPTPLSTTSRKDGQKMCLEPQDFYSFEAQRLLTTAEPLYLEPALNPQESDRVIAALSHPQHSARPPSSKTRKRTTAELAAEDAIAAEAERRMLIMDERIKPAGLNTKGATGEGGQQAAMGGLAFGRFKTIELVRAQHEEKEAKKKEEETRAAEARKAQEEARANSNASQLATGTAGVGAAPNAGSGVQINEAQQRLMQQRMHQQKQLAQMRAQQQQQQQLQAQLQAQQQAQNAQQNSVQVGQQQGHPPGSAGGLIAGQANMAMPQQSPIVRNQTPNGNVQSSPMIQQVGFPMSQTGSQQGIVTAAGSPARPSSAIAMHPVVNMARNGSQQQHTPQMHHSTPQVPNRNLNNASATGNRGMSATPVNQQQLGMKSPAAMTNGMNAGTPMNPMATPHMGNAGLGVPSGSLTQEQITILQQQRQQQLAQQQAQLNGINQQGNMTAAGSPPNGMTPSQFSQARAQSQLQSQLQQQYQASVRQYMGAIMQRDPTIPQQVALQQAQQVVRQRSQQANMQRQAASAGSPMPGSQNMSHPQQPGGNFNGTPQMGGANMGGGSDQQALMQARQQQIMAQHTMQQQQQGIQQLKQIASQHGGQIPQQIVVNLPPQLQMLLRQQQQQQQLARMRAATAAQQGQRAGGMPSTPDDREQYMAALRQHRMFLGQGMNNGMNMSGGGGGGGGGAGLNMVGQSFNGQGNGSNGDLNQSFAAMQAALQGGGGQRPGQGSGM